MGYYAPIPEYKKCFDDAHRVLKPGGKAWIMFYYKHSPVGYMVWIRYALLRFKRFTPLSEIYHKFLESPGTKAFSKTGAFHLTEKFSKVNLVVKFSFGDLLEGNVDARHSGKFLDFAKFVYRQKLIKILGTLFPFGLYLLIELEK